jgi:hypothetical protein
MCVLFPFLSFWYSDYFTSIQKNLLSGMRSFSEIGFTSHFAGGARLPTRDCASKKSDLADQYENSFSGLVKKLS